MKIFAIIEHHNAGASNLPVPIQGNNGVLGQAFWNGQRKAHCLKVPIDLYRKNRLAIVQTKPKFVELSVDFEVEEQDVPERSPADQRLSSMGRQDEPPIETLARLLAEYQSLALWRPNQGRKPEATFLQPQQPAQ